MPHISGSDVAGEVVASAAADVAIGTPRDAAARESAADAARRACPARDNECPRLRGARLSATIPAATPSIVKVPVQNLIPIPDAIDFVQAAAFPLTFQTAWHMLITRAHG